jgi:outer membrane receptor for ferrienterochelin and colicins
LRYALAFAVALWATEAGADEPEQVVVTGTRTPENIQKATVKTDVVTREEAERRGATSVADALALQPGLNVNPGNYGFLGGVSALQIQGFDRDRVLILEDGERVVGDVGGAIDLSTFPLGDVDRIEIVSGPASSLYGSAALGGVINIITSPPKEYGPSGRFRAEYRSLNGVVLQGNAAYKSEKPLLGLRDPWAEVDGNYMRMDAIPKGGGLPDTRIPETNDAMLGLRTGARLNDAMDIRVRARIFRDRQDGVSSSLAPGLGRFITDNPTQTDRYTLHVIHVTKFRRGANLRLTLGRQEFDNFTANEQRNSPIDERHDRTQRLQSLEAVATVPDGPLTWVAGARFEAEHFEQDITKTVSTSTGPQTTTAPEVMPLAYGTAAAYAQTTWKIRENVTVMPGVRSEIHTKFGASITPRLAAAWQITPKWNLRASAGRGFRAPSAKELGFVFDHTIYGYKIQGNPDLKPEKSWGVNADITWTPLEKPEQMMLRGSVYANWVEELIDLDLAHGTFDGPVVTYRYANFGRARTAGAQLDASFKPAKWITSTTSYAYTWTRDDTAEQPLPGRPPHTVTSAITIEPGWKLQFIARARVTTSSFLDENSRSPGYQTVDLRAGRTLWPHSQLYVGALDLLDVKQDPNRIGDTRPPLGRVLYVGLRADFPWDDAK